eukprot:6816060-Prymnesium_polylepis.1
MLAAANASEMSSSGSTGSCMALASQACCAAIADVLGSATIDRLLPSIQPRKSTKGRSRRACINEISLAIRTRARLGGSDLDLRRAIDAGRRRGPRATRAPARRRRSAAMRAVA